MKVFLALVFNKESVCRHRVSIFARHCHAWSLVWISSSGGLSSYSLCWSCWHLTSLIKAIVCPDFAILIVQSIYCTRGTSSLFCPQRVSETDGLELLVVTNTIPQVSFFSIKLRQGGKSTKALPLSGGETWEVWQVEGDWRDTDLCRGAEVHCVHCKRVMVIMMAILTHVVAIGWDWTIHNTKYNVVVVPGANRRASASTMCFAWTNSIDCPNNLGTRWKKASTISF